MNKLAKTVDLQEPWQTPNAIEWDNMSLADWMQKQMGFETARRFFKVAAEAIWAADPSEISMLHAMFYTKSGGDLDMLMNVKNGAQEERFVGGAQTIANKMAATFQDKIRLDFPVKAILQTGDLVTVIGSDFRFTAKKVVVAIPPVLAKNIDYQPLMPLERERLTEQMFMGSVWKTYAIYDKPFLARRRTQRFGCHDRRLCYGNI